MTTDWKAKEAVSYLTAQPMREITTRTQQLDFPSSSRLRGSCRLFLEANTATRRPEKSTAERSRTKKINLELQLASKKPAVLQKSRKVRNGRTGRFEGFKVQLASPNSTQQLGKRAQSAASVLKVASWSLEGLYPHSGKQLNGVEWRQTEKCQNLFRQMKTEITGCNTGWQDAAYTFIYTLFINIYTPFWGKESPAQHKASPLFGSLFRALRICLWFERLSKFLQNLSIQAVAFIRSSSAGVLAKCQHSVMSWTQLEGVLISNSLYCKLAREMDREHTNEKHP